MSKPSPKPFLLDTHVWVGLINGDARVCSPKILEIIEKYAPGTDLYVSVMSAWEVAMLEAKGRLWMPQGCQRWTEQALSAPDIRLAELTPSIAVQSTRLPGKFHGDPVDRILIATALSLDAVLVSRDREIARYCREHAVSHIA